MCDELCKWLEVDMKEGVHYPKELDFTFDALAESMANLDIKRNICSSKPEHSTVVSMTGVSILFPSEKIIFRSTSKRCRRRFNSFDINATCFRRRSASSTHIPRWIIIIDIRKLARARVVVRRYQARYYVCKLDPTLQNLFIFLFTF